MHSSRVVFGCIKCIVGLQNMTTVDLQNTGKLWQQFVFKFDNCCGHSHTSLHIFPVGLQNRVTVDLQTTGTVCS